MLRHHSRELTIVGLYALTLAACGGSKSSPASIVDAGFDDAGSANAHSGSGGSNAGSGGAHSAGASGSAIAGTGESGTGGASGESGAAGAGGASGESGESGSAAAGGGAGQQSAGSGGAGSGAGGAGAAGAGSGGAGSGGSGGGSAGQSGSAGSSGASGSGGGCGADNAPCAPATDVQGYCSNNTCVSCMSGASGNTSCSLAYGSGSGYVCAAGDCVAGQCVANADCGNGQLCGASTANQCGGCQSDAQCTGAGGYGTGYLCIANACVLANCRADGDCPTGEICGVQAPNICAPCATDSQCQNDTGSYGPSFICDTGTHRCVSASCTPNNQTCGANAADFCCAGSCISGNCCGTGDCSGLGNNYTCVNNNCTLCAQATNNTYYVDPANGSDVAGTGNNATSGCAFKTISRALSVIGSAPNPNTKVYVLATGAVGTVTSGEIFPIDVPGNVMISGSGGRPMIAVPANTNGFLLHHPASGLSNLTVDGTNHTASYGVYVSAGSDVSTTLASLDVQNMARDGIRVAGTGVLTVSGGVHATLNGTSGNPADGLHVGDQAHAKIVVLSGDAVHFDHNTAHGIYVVAAGSIELSGAPGSGGAGTITTSFNTAAGLWIEQTPGASVPTNTVTGLVSWANTGNGLRIVGGSAATLRQSYILANGSNGILISTYVNGGARNNDTSKIDLGSTTGPSYGGNTVQAALGGNPNSAAGICLSLDRMAGSTLNAAGNIFSGPTDCSSSTATLTKNGSCSGAVDYSVRTTGTTTNAIVVSQCH